jgi:iron complex transport system permease protein
MRKAVSPAQAWAVVAALALCFVLLRSGLDLGYVIPRRLERLAAMALGAVCVAVSSICFQTLAGNRILTPAIMGYEAVYLLLQALLVLLLGVQSLALLGPAGQFWAGVASMLAYSWLLHRSLWREGRHDVHFLLLLGLVLGMVMGTLTQFVQLRISPGEFSVLQGMAQTSFVRAGPAQLLWSVAIVAAVCGVVFRSLPTLDVLALGREQAISLGVDHRRQLRLHLALTAILVAVSTSLLGPSAFMGIFVAHTSYALARTARHAVTLPLGCAVAMALFITAQMAVEHVFNYRTSVGILVNLVCGGYFLVLMLRARAGT